MIMTLIPMIPMMAMPVFGEDAPEAPPPTSVTAPSAMTTISGRVDTHVMGTVTVIVSATLTDIVDLDVTGWFTEPALPGLVTATLRERSDSGVGAARRVTYDIIIAGTPTEIIGDDRGVRPKFTIESGLLNGATGNRVLENTLRLIVLPEPDGDMAENDLIIWADAPNSHIGLNLSKETLVEIRRADWTTGAVTAITDAELIKSFHNGKRWTAIRTEKSAFATGDRPLLPRLLNKAISNLTISTAELDRDSRNEAGQKNLNRGNPKGGISGDHIIRFTGSIAARPRFNNNVRLVVNYAPSATQFRDTWTLTARKSDVPLYTIVGTKTDVDETTVIPDVNFGVLDRVLISDEVTKENRREPRTWSNLLSLTGERTNFKVVEDNVVVDAVTPTIGDGNNAIPNPFAIRPLSDDGKVVRVQYILKEDARQLPTGVFVPTSREMRIRILGHGKAPSFKDPAAKTPNTIRARAGIQFVSVADTGLVTPMGLTKQTIGTTADVDVVEFGNLWVLPLTSAAKTITLLGGAGEGEAADTGNISVRFAANAKRPASAIQTMEGITFSRPAPPATPEPTTGG